MCSIVVSPAERMSHIPQFPVMMDGVREWLTNMNGLHMRLYLLFVCWMFIEDGGETVLRLRTLDFHARVITIHRVIGKRIRVQGYAPLMTILLLLTCDIGGILVMVSVWHTHLAGMHQRLSMALWRTLSVIEVVTAVTFLILGVCDCLTTVVRSQARPGSGGALWSHSCKDSII